MHTEEEESIKREKGTKQEKESFTRATCEHETERDLMASRMSSVWGAIALACAAMAATATTAATTHKVGDNEGWRVPDTVSFYTTWASDKTFNVGDKLEFEWMGVHNVAEVTKNEYENCTKAGTPNSNSPVTVSLDAAGSKYFICTVGPHCSLGQKLSVTVGSNSPTTPTPTPAAPAPGSAPASLLANALSAAMFTIGSMFFICL